MRERVNDSFHMRFYYPLKVLDQKTVFSPTLFEPPKNDYDQESSYPDNNQE
jgi:hypothetical protein